VKTVFLGQHLDFKRMQIAVLDIHKEKLNDLYILSIIEEYHLLGYDAM
jgi:hypothetical protein